MRARRWRSRCVDAWRWSMPLRSEAMGRVHLEAMACRKLVIATRTSGALDCVEDGRTGLPCAVENVDDLAAKLQWVLPNPDQARAMGEQGFGRLRREFSGEMYVKIFQVMVNEVIRADGASSDDGGAVTAGRPTEIADRGRGGVGGGMAGLL